MLLTWLLLSHSDTNPRLTFSLKLALNTLRLTRPWIFFSAIQQHAHTSTPTTARTNTHLCVHIVATQLPGISFPLLLWQHPNIMGHSLTWQQQEHGAITSLPLFLSRHISPSLPPHRLEGQNGQSLHKLQLVQLQKNVPRVLVIFKGFWWNTCVLFSLRGEIVSQG